MLPVQSRMSRAALGWSVRDLAKAMTTSPDTVARFERGEELKPLPDFSDPTTSEPGDPIRRAISLPKSDAQAGFQVKVQSSVLIIG